MVSMNTDAALKRLAVHGPDRVVVNRHGEGRPPRLEPDVPIQVILIRRDGWTLGAPWDLAEVAKRLWVGEWAAFVLPTHGLRPRPMNEWGYWDA